MISSALVLQNITMEDKGVYSCRAEISPTKYKDATAKVIVYGEHNLRKKKDFRFIDFVPSPVLAVFLYVSF